MSAAHAQARRGIAVTVAFLVAASVTAAAGVGDGWWVPLHLFAVGGLLSAISAATVMLAVTWSASPAPPARLAALQRWVLVAGANTMVGGRARDTRWMFAVGGVLVVAAVALLAVMLWGVRRSAVVDRYAPAIEAYVLAMVLGCTGMSIGLVLGTGHGGSRIADLRGAHLTLNLFGLVGLVIAGTLPYFTATQVRAKMSRAATPRVLRVTNAALAVSVAAAAVGRALGHPSVAAALLLAYAALLIVVAALLPIYRRDRWSWAGPRAVQLVAGLAWWVAGTALLARVVAAGGSDGPVLRALAIGGFAQILVASLAYLGPVLRRGGHELLTAGFRTTRSWVSVVCGNVAAGAALAERPWLLGAVLAVWTLDIVGRAGRLLLAAR